MSEPAAKKSLGQHWLRDLDSLESICEAADVGPGDTVLEVGPGLGTLTAQLVKRAGHVYAVEFDERLAAGLSRDYALQTAYRQKLDIIRADILTFDLGTLPAGYKVVANIPYYLTSNLLRVLCESNNPFTFAALLVQKEVAERVCAAPGQMSILSITTQYFCECSLGDVVPAVLFEPPPKVDSQILKLKYRTRPLFPDIDTRQFFRLVKAGFATRRKTLENSLATGLHLSKEGSRQLITAAGLDPQSRAQNLSLDDWHALYRVYSSAAPPAAWEK